jgi:sugar/nucleoside kinase (ribokinase family)
MSLVVVGSIGLDTIETRVGKVSEALGGSAVYASLAARNFTDTFIVGVVGEDFPVSYREILQKHDVRLDGMQTVKGKTFRWGGKYEDWNHADTLFTELNVFADFAPMLPDSCKCCRSLLLGNIHPQLQLQVLDQINSYDYVACDTMNFWISGCPDLLSEVIKRVDIVFMNEGEILQYTDRNDIYSAAEQILRQGPKVIVVKRGEYGSVVVTQDYYFFVPAFPVKQVVDPTGAGDSFAGGFMGYLANHPELNPETIKEAVRYGTVLAAMNVGAFSVDNLLNPQPGCIQNRVDQLKSWT